MSSNHNEELRIADIDGYYLPTKQSGSSDNSPWIKEKYSLYVHTRLSYVSFYNNNKQFLTKSVSLDENCQGFVCKVDEFFCFDNKMNDGINNTINRSRKDCHSVQKIHFLPSLEMFSLHFEDTSTNHSNQQQKKQQQHVIIYRKHRNHQQHSLSHHLCDAQDSVEGEWKLEEQLTQPYLQAEDREIMAIPFKTHQDDQQLIRSKRSYQEEMRFTCPHAMNFWKNFTLYSCGHAYNFAAFFNSNNNNKNSSIRSNGNGCKILPLRQSLQLFQQFYYPQKIPKIMAIGDSLIRQLAETMNCDSEYILQQNTLSEIEYEWTSHLRTDLLCVPSCGNGTEYSNFKCHGCQNQQYFTFGSENDQKINQMIFRWAYFRSYQDTNIMILHTGAWYSPFNFIEGNSKFEETIKYVKIHLQYLLTTNPKLRIIWLGLSPQLEIIEKFGYQYFPKRDEIVKEMIQSFQNHRFIFIDVAKYTKGRRLQDPNIARDYLHWCEPGAFSIPSMLFELVMNLYIRDVMVTEALGFPT